MKIVTTHDTDIAAVTAVRLTGNAATWSDGTVRHQVAVGHSLTTFAYLSAGEMSELGHRFIELAAQADERANGPLDVERAVA